MEFNPSKRCLPVGEELKYLTEVSLFFFLLQCTDSNSISSLFPSDVLALPIFKQEESNLPADNENKILPFQYVLCAATSPAIKLHDETLTYLNQGQFENPSHRKPFNFV